MGNRATVLTIGGSDGTGESGIQADIMTIAALGGRALTGVTCITTRRDGRLTGIVDLPSEIVREQVAAAIAEQRPGAIKTGLLRDVEAIRKIREEVIGCRHLVVAPGIYTAEGVQMTDERAIEAIKSHLIPIA